MRNLSFSIFIFCITITFSCKHKQMVDTLVYNATIYTVDSNFSTAQAMAIKDGRIVATGEYNELEKLYQYKERINASGGFIYPGFIDAHAHFVNYGLSLHTVNLTGTTSWEQVVERVMAFAKKYPSIPWITGRGWDQNDWAVKNFPVNDKLNKLFSNKPVLLTRIDGHAAMANNKALELAGVNNKSFTAGGSFEKKDGKLTGLLIDNAVDFVQKKIPKPSKEDLKQALLQGQDSCYAAGLTSINDCGLDVETVKLLREFQDAGELSMRLYVLLSDEPASYDWLKSTGIIKTPLLHIQGFKVYADGALGSRGACLLQPYSDKPGWRGFLLSTPAHIDSVARIIYANSWQLCTHAIGDSGNRTVLNIYKKYLHGSNPLRWRIEHAQVVNSEDFNLFGANAIIPSVQPTHATSDMYWAGSRLGSQRLADAYAYKKLLNQNGWLPLGTDFPIEDISPLKTFWAATLRQDANRYPPAGFQMENALTPQQALKGISIWAARACFEEKDKGSLEKGKYADFVILNHDLLKAGADELQNTGVYKTFVNGKKVFEKK